MGQTTARLRRCIGLRALALVVSLLNCGAVARADATLQALDLADNTQFAGKKYKTVHLIAEGSRGWVNRGIGVRRASFDLRLDVPFTDGGYPAWRATVANRYDYQVMPGGQGKNAVNTLKEAYLTYQPAEGALVDAGRVNTRYGVAFGYNPTDFLGEGAVRSAVSADPDVLRNNRLGTLMMRTQYVWNRGSFTANWAPKVGDRPSDRTFSPDWARSNPRDRLLLVGSHRLADGLNPQMLVLLERGRSPQWGGNVSHVVSRSTLAYGEWAGGRQPYRWQALLPVQQQSQAWRHRLATGFTWTGENRLMLRLEGSYDGSADFQRARSFLSQPQIVMQRDQTGGAESGAAMQAPRRASLLQAYWQNIIDDSDLNLIARRDLQQSNTNYFVELRHHFSSADVAVQWQKLYLPDASLSLDAEQRVQLVATYFF